MSKLTLIEAINRKRNLFESYDSHILIENEDEVVNLEFMEECVNIIRSHLRILSQYHNRFETLENEFLLKDIDDIYVYFSDKIKKKLIYDTI